jgi:hypothetical protein
VILGGRNLAGPADPAARFTLAVDGRAVDAWDVPPGFFLRTLDLPEGTLTGGEGLFAELSVQSVPVAGEAPIPTAVEQFDVQSPETLMWGFGAGWHEAEYAPAVGLWHWTAGRADLQVAGATADVRVTLDFEPPQRYFPAPSQLRASAGTRELENSAVGAAGSWSFDVPLDALRASGGVITVETSQTFTPAERGQGADRRRLGLRVLKVRMESAGLR